MSLRCRLPWVYAMARLADDWQVQRHVCIDVVCAHLRMPYEPDPHKGSRILSTYPFPAPAMPMMMR